MNNSRLNEDLSLRFFTPWKCRVRPAWPRSCMRVWVRLHLCFGICICTYARVCTSTSFPSPFMFSRRGWACWYLQIIVCNMKETISLVYEFAQKHNLCCYNTILLWEFPPRTFLFSSRSALVFMCVCEMWVSLPVYHVDVNLEFQWLCCHTQIF